MHRLAAVTLAALLCGCAAPVDTLRSEPAELVWQGPVAPRVVDKKPSRRRAVTDIPPVLLRVRACESRGDYQARNPRSTASGAWQALDGTWNGYGGYRRAYLAPREVQDRWALRLYRRSGLRPWYASKACWAR